MYKAIISAILAFLLWGSLPIYWKLLSAEPMVVLCHRIIWSLVFLRLWLILIKKKPIRPNLIALIRALVIMFNWGIYIFAVHNGHILASSIGYFIAPIFYMLTGLMLDKEKVSKTLITVILLFSIAAINLAIGHLEDIAISFGLALTINIYGIIQRYFPCKNNIVALEQEALCLAPLALTWLYFSNELYFPLDFPKEYLFLIGAGPVTILPLIFYGYAIQRMNLSLFGIITFISPTVQFLLASFIYCEPIDKNRLISLTLVWLGILIYLRHLYARYRSQLTNGSTKQQNV